MSQLPDPNIPQIRIVSVQPEGANRMQVLAVCHPHDTEIQLSVGLPFSEGVQYDEHPQIWQILADVLEGWSRYARDKYASIQARTYGQHQVDFR